MYKDIFINLSLFYPDFYDSYEKFYMERFIYSSTEIEGIKTKDERKIFVSTLMRAFHETYNYEVCGRLDVTMIRNIGNLINNEKGLEDFRKNNVYPGDNASFTPAAPCQIYPYLYSLIDNYYNVWNLLDPFLREAMFHINFMRIHPFEDGNKRCAKIILAIILNFSQASSSTRTLHDPILFIIFLFLVENTTYSAKIRLMYASDYGFVAVPEA